jgi:hypothetical protein
VLVVVVGDINRQRRKMMLGAKKMWSINSTLLKLIAWDETTTFQDLYSKVLMQTC